MRASIVAAVFLCVSSGAARAQDLPFDSVRVTFASDGGLLAGDGSTFEVSRDGRFVLTKPGGERSRGVLAPGERFLIAKASERAPFASSDGRTLGSTGDGVTFKLEARSGERRFAVSGSARSEDLGEFGRLVQALEGATEDRLTAYEPGRRKLFAYSPPPARLPGSLEGEIGDRKFTILGDRSVKIVTPSRTFETTLTEEEVRGLRRAVREVDHRRSWGEAVDDSPRTGPPGEKFKLVVYETFNRYLVEGEVGRFGDRLEFGALVLTLRSIAERVEHPPVVAPIDRDDGKPPAESFWDSLRRRVARVFSTRESAPPSRARGMSELLEERLGEAHDRARSRGVRVR